MSYLSFATEAVGSTDDPDCTLVGESASTVDNMLRFRLR